MEKMVRPENKLILEIKHGHSWVSLKQGRKRPFDTPKRMIERRERERRVEGEI